MNRNFKVVFSKARGALMVVNEATSSVQAKGTKTVIAAAVAALSLGAGVASAADDATAYTKVEIGADSSVVLADKQTAAGNNVVGTYTDGTENKEKNISGVFTQDVTSYTLADGTLKVQGKDVTGKTIAIADGKSGTLVIEATKNTVGSWALDDTSYENLNLNLNVYNAKKDGQAYGSTVSASGALALKSGALTIDAITDSDTSSTKAPATATLSATGPLEFGVRDDLYDDGEVKTAGSVYDITNNGQKAVLEGSTVAYNKGTVTNSGDLTIQSTDQQNGSVEISDQVGFANTGTISIEATSGNVEFDADYDTAANQGGQIFFKVADTAAIKLSGAVAADTVKVGEKVKDEKNQIVFEGNTEISGDASLSAKTLTLSGKTLTVQADNNLQVVKRSLKAQKRSRHFS